MGSNDGSVIVINFDSMHGAAQDIQTALDGIESALTDAEQAASPLVSTWEGGAQQAYQQRQTKWRNAADDLSRMLKDLKVAVEESANDFLTRDNNARNKFETH